MSFNYHYNSKNKKNIFKQLSRQYRRPISEIKSIYHRFDRFLADHTDADDDLRVRVALLETIKELGGIA